MVGQGQLQGIAVRRDWKKAEKQKQNKTGIKRRTPGGTYV